jgi:hypothetical protein
MNRCFSTTSLILCAAAAVAASTLLWAFGSRTGDHAPIGRMVSHEEGSQIRGGATPCDEYGEYMDAACTYSQPDACVISAGSCIGDCPYACIKKPHWRFKAGAPKVTLKDGVPCPVRSYYTCFLYSVGPINYCGCDAPIIMGPCTANPMVKDADCAPGS